MPDTHQAVDYLREVCARLHDGGTTEYVGTTTAVGSATTLVDGQRLRYEDADTDALGAPVVRIDGLVGSGPASGEIAFVRENGLAVATGTVTVTPPFSAAVQAATPYSRWSVCHPMAAWRALNRVMRTLREEVLLPLTLVEDGDMEANSTTAWAVGPSGTAEKVTAPERVRHGLRSLRLAGNSLNVLWRESFAIRVVRNDQLLVSAHAMADVGTARLVLWDATQSAEIMRGESSEEAYMEIDLQYASVPQGCEEVTVRLEGTGVNDNLYWDDVIVWPRERGWFTLPSWVADPAAVLDVGYFERGRGISGSNYTYMVDEGNWRSWPFSRGKVQERGATMFQLRIATPVRRPLYARVVRPGTEFTADTGTATADLDLVAGLTVREIYMMLETEALIAKDEDLSLAWTRKRMLVEQQENVAGWLSRQNSPEIVVRYPRRGRRRH